MGAVIDFFKEFGKILSSIVDMIIDFCKGVVQFFTDIPEYIETVSLYIDLLPASIKTIALMTLSFILIFIVIGRRGK